MALFVAKIAVSKAIYTIDKPYDYLVPEVLHETLQVGMRVLVPFGRGDRGADGLVLSIASLSNYESQLKFIHVQLDETPVLNEEGVALAIWMRSMYYCTLYDCVRAMLPTGLFFALKDSLTLHISEEEALEQTKSSPMEQKVIETLIQLGGEGELQQIRLAMGLKNPTQAIRALVDRSILRWESSAKRNTNDKMDQIVTLAMPTEDALAYVTPQQYRYPLRFALVEMVCQVGDVSVKELCYYTGAKPNMVKTLEKNGVFLMKTEEVLRSPQRETVAPDPLPVLNDEQTAAFSGISALFGQAAVALLYGVTGSGKTQVYIALIHKILAEGKTAMVLVPEIALTPQLLRVFSAQFGENIAILHSGLRVGERYDEWKRVKRGDARVVLGTRSAVFAPLENLGLLILDEEQETSYKSDQRPRYHTREIGKYRCFKQKAVLLLGSATPSVDTMYYALMGTYSFFSLKTRYNQEGMPKVTIVDMKQELKEGNRTAISKVLQEELRENLVTEEQAILFHNRRGKNQMLSCGDCGFVSECPNCSAYLTYHGSNDRLMCHYCNFSYVRPNYCPECNGLFNYIGFGTQQIEADMKEIFPHEAVLRMDADTVSASRTHQAIFDQFNQENVPALIGTQMVAKGLDFENVTLVGVISADLSLYAEDLWASERTFSLITQVVGRAGRGKKKGRALIQTYTPEHTVVLAAAEQNYDRFYQQEILARELRQHPPFREMILFCASGAHEMRVVDTLYRVRQSLDQGISLLQENITILGPAPAPVVRMHNRFRYQITIFAKHTKGLRLLLEQILTAAQSDKENKTVWLHIDRLLH